MSKFASCNAAGPMVIRHHVQAGEAEQTLRIFQRNASLAQLFSDQAHSKITNLTTYEVNQSSEDYHVKGPMRGFRVYLRAND